MKALEKAARAADVEFWRQAEAVTDSFLYAQADVPGKTICLDGDVDLVALARAVISSIEVDDAMVEVAADRLYGSKTWRTIPPEAKDDLGENMRAALKAFLHSILVDGEGR